jgi:hypothetical protein
MLTAPDLERLEQGPQSLPRRCKCVLDVPPSMFRAPPREDSVAHEILEPRRRQLVRRIRQRPLQLAQAPVTTDDQPEDGGLPTLADDLRRAFDRGQRTRERGPRRNDTARRIGIANHGGLRRSVSPRQTGRAHRPSANIASASPPLARLRRRRECRRRVRYAPVAQRPSARRRRPRRRLSTRTAGRCAPLPRPSVRSSAGASVVRRTAPAAVGD